MQLGPRLGLQRRRDGNRGVAGALSTSQLSATSFQRDLMDPKTIETFAALIQSPERLRLLLVLTVCDIRAVGPNVWNNWKAAAAAPALQRDGAGHLGRHADGRPRRAHQAYPDRDSPAPAGLERGRRGERRFARGYASYWLSFPPETPGPPGRTRCAARERRQATARHRAPGRRGALGHRGHDLHARHARPVRPSRRRHGDQRRQHRRRQDLHPGQRHGARHVLDPGPRGQAVRRTAAAGATRCARRAGAVQPTRHPARTRQPARLLAQARPASSPSSRAC